MKRIGSVLVAMLSLAGCGAYLYATHQTTLASLTDACGPHQTPDQPSGGCNASTPGWGVDAIQRMVHEIQRSAPSMTSAQVNCASQAIQSYYPDYAAYDADMNTGHPVGAASVRAKYLACGP